MSHNTFGHLFRVTTFGESHGPAIGCVVDGCPPGIALTEADIQADLERRRPGQSKFVTQRQEPDAVKILSGVFQDERMAQQLTTGTPIGLLIENVDQRSKDYSDIRDKFRPGHADYTYEAKYGVRDYRGGGRSSARETAMRVAAGAIARKVLDSLYGKVTIRAALVQMGTKVIDRSRWDWAETANNPFFCPDPGAVAPWTEYLESIRKQGSSVGAVVEVVAEGIPAGLGAPIYGKLDSELASALMSINAVKGVEIGDGFATAAMTGEQNADEMRAGNQGKPEFLANHAGGILGGISTGQSIVARFAVKPTSSILSPRKTVDKAGTETDIVTKGRHDPCVGIRAVPVGEAMMAIVLADAALRHGDKWARFLGLLAMTNSIHCEIHGSQQETWVCQHIIVGLESRRRVGFFWTVADPDNPRPDAYCRECEDRVRVTGGDWVGEALEHLEPKCLCGACYDLAKAFNMGGNPWS